MPLSIIFVIASFVTLVTFIIFYFFAVIRHDNGLADVVWGLGAVLSGVTAYMLGGFHYAPAQTVVMLMLAAWGLRLAGHIYTRNRGKEEDFRYQLMRARWGKNQVVRSLLEIYVVQWLLLIIIVSPVVVILSTPPINFGVIGFVGITLWVIGFGMEFVADYQLYMFKLRNKEGLYTSGLWKKSRHPNYFGEMMLWSGFFLIALEHPLGLFTIISPLVLAYLLTKVSIPTVEKRMMKKKGYKEYSSKTRALLPF